MDYIIYGIIGIIILSLVLKLFKLPFKILFNGILGVVLLYIANLVGTYVGFSIAINAVTALIAGFLGVPGVIFLVIYQMFL